jgi:uroporphyrinogen decarboxylase
MKRNGLDVIQRVMQHEVMDEIPWVPYVGVHAGYLKGYSASEVLRDEDKLLESLLAANDLYKPDGQVVYFDLQLEAEVLGCKLDWVDHEPPKVVGHPLMDTDEIPIFMPNGTEGRIPLVMSAVRRLKESVGSHTAIYGLCCGPFTLAAHLRGSRFFMDIVKNPEYVKKLMHYCTQMTRLMAELYMQAGCDVIAPVDPLASKISPKHFTQICKQHYEELFTEIRRWGFYSTFIVCGNIKRNIEVMCSCGPDCISVDEMMDMVLAKSIADEYDVVLAGNIPPVDILQQGSQQDSRQYVAELMDSIDSSRNFVLSSGFDLPRATVEANLVACARTAYELGNSVALRTIA